MKVEFRLLRSFDEYPLSEYVQLFADWPLFSLTRAEIPAWVEKLLLNGVVYILDMDGHLGGFHGYYVNDTENHVCYGAGTIVNAALRGTGWGSRFIAKTIVDARAHGMTSYTANVVKDNVRALAFYQRLGFTVVGPGRDDEHVLIRKELV